MSRRRKARWRRAAPPPPHAVRMSPTPAAFHLAEVDNTRTFLVFQASTASIVGFTDGEAPTARVRCDVAGKWNHGAEDEQTLIASTELVREWAAQLVEAADAADRDLATYLSGVHPDDGSRR